MITEGVILNALAIIVLIILPCIFKASFNKIKGCFSFCLGFCCYFTTSVIDGIIFFIFSYIMGDKGYFEDDEIRQKDFDNIDDYLEFMLEKAKSLVVFSLLMMFLLSVVIFLMLFLFIKRLSGQQSIYGAIFMFISGYFFLYIEYFGILLLLSNIGESVFDKIDDEDYRNSIYLDYAKKIFGKIILYSDLILLIHILSIIGTSFMLFLHHKRANNSIIIICIVTYFIPIISIILGVIAKKFVIFWIIMEILNLLSFILGFILYCKYYKKDDEVDVKSLGFIEPQSPIQPPY
jgi:hypothetical protein